LLVPAPVTPEEFMAEMEALDAGKREPGTFVDVKTEEFLKAARGEPSPLGEALRSFHKKIRRGAATLGAGHQFRSGRTESPVGNRSMEKSSDLEIPSLYDLYGPAGLLNLERSIAKGKIPTAAELAAVPRGQFRKALTTVVCCDSRQESARRIKETAGPSQGRPVIRDSLRTREGEISTHVTLHGCRNVSVRPASKGGPRFAEKIGGLVHPTNALPELLLRGG